MNNLDWESGGHEGIQGSMTLSGQIWAQPLDDHVGHLAGGVQDKGVPEPSFTQPEVCLREVQLHVLVELQGAPVVRGAVIEYQLCTWRTQYYCKNIQS